MYVCVCAILCRCVGLSGIQGVGGIGVASILLQPARLSGKRMSMKSSHYCVYIQ